MTSSEGLTSGAAPAAGHQKIHLAHHCAAAVASLALAGVIGLAFLSAAEPTPADKVTLLGLGLMAAVAFWTPLFRWLELQENAAAYALTAAGYIFYTLARQTGPTSGWAVGPAADMAGLDHSKFAISYAARLVVGAAIVTAPFWVRRLNGWTWAVLAAAAVLAVFSLGIFGYLRNFYDVGPTATIDPTALPYLWMQIVEFASLALVCNVVASHPPARRYWLRALPLILLIMWFRHRHTMPKVEEDDQ